MARLSEDLSSGTDDKLFSKACFVINTLPDEHLIKIKHHADCRNATAMSRAAYADSGQCRVLTPGVLNYSFQVLIRDQVEDNTLYVNIGDRGGASLFGMSARAFNAMARAAQEKAKARVA